MADTDAVIRSDERRVVITANRTRATAPAGIYLEAQAEGFSVEDHHTDLRYRWSFDDPDTLYTRFDSNDLPWERVEDETGRTLGYSSNVAYGPHCSHVWFPAPDEFTAERARTGNTHVRNKVTVEVLSREMVLAGEAPVTATLDILVEDPEAVFPPIGTFCISPSGDFAGAPENAIKVATFEDAVAASKARRQSRVRFLFRRGEMHDATLKTSWMHPEQYTHMHGGAFGEGAPPVLGWTGEGFGLRAAAGEGESALWGLDMRGSYDPTRPEEMTEADTQPGLSLSRALFHTVWDCSLSGFSTALRVSKDLSNLVVGNVHVTSWFDYGFFAGTGLSHAGFCGVAIKQKLGTEIGKGKGDPVEGPRHANHGPWRCSQNVGPVSFNLCDFRSLNSWSGAIQPCVRLGGNGGKDYPLSSENNFDRCRAENGQMIGSGTFKGAAYPKHAVYDKIYQVLAHSGTGPLIGIGCSGMIIRNVVTVLADQPRLNGSYGVLVMRRDIEAGEPSNSEYPVRIYNSTFVDARSAQNDTSKAEGGLVPVHYESFAEEPAIPVVFENNLIYVPNRGLETWNAPEGYVPPEPLDLRVLWEVTFDGKRFAESPFDPLYATPPGTAALYAPLPGSSAYESAEGEVVAIDDFFGRIRGSRPSRGAVEPT